MPVKFTKRLMAAESYESASVFDVNGDGNLDIVSGGFWYEGPEFLKRYGIGSVKREGEYYDDFATIPLDVNGDGRMDFITGGWWGNTMGTGRLDIVAPGKDGLHVFFNDGI